MEHGVNSPQRPTNAASVRLVCLPFAGGGSAPYYRWRRYVPDWIKLAPVTLPGHDGRLAEPPLTDLRTVVESLVDGLQPTLDKPFVLLGHSMGAWLAFEMAPSCAAAARLPELLVVAANRAPHLRWADSPIYSLPDQEFLEVLGRRYGRMPPAVSASPELLQLLMPALRADIQMIESYRFVDEPPLETEILVLGGSDDPVVSAAQLEGWRHHTSLACSVRLLPGRHFFLFDAGSSSRSGTSVHSSESTPALRMIVERIEKCRSASAADCPAAKSQFHGN